MKKVVITSFHFKSRYYEQKVIALNYELQKSLLRVSKVVITRKRSLLRTSTVIIPRERKIVITSFKSHHSEKKGRYYEKKIIITSFKSRYCFKQCIIPDGLYMWQYKTWRQTIPSKAVKWISQDRRLSLQSPTYSTSKCHWKSHHKSGTFLILVG